MVHHQSNSIFYLIPTLIITSVISVSQPAYQRSVAVAL